MIEMGWTERQVMEDITIDALEALSNEFRFREKQYGK